MKKISNYVLLMATIAAITWQHTVFAQTKLITAFCPHIDEIKKNHTKGNWTAQNKIGYWKSYGTSFATTLTRFVGAQWTGANVGQITCIYHSHQQFKMQGQLTIQPTLPVLLAFHTYVYQPREGAWKHIKRGVYNCYSGKQSDCPFTMKPKTAVGNIYDEAESLKSEDDSSSIEPPSY